MKRMLFWAKERLIKSFVAGQVIAFVSGWEETHPELWDGLISYGLTDHLKIEK